MRPRPAVTDLIEIACERAADPVDEGEVELVIAQLLHVAPEYVPFVKAKVRRLRQEATDRRALTPLARLRARRRRRT